MDPILVFQQMAILLLMIVAGYVANKTGIMGKESEKYCSRVLVNITNPALIISSVATSQRLESTGMLLTILMTATVYFLLLMVLGKGISRITPIDREKKPELECMLIFANIGFMGIPVANAILGSQSVLYITVFIVLFNILLFSYGTVLLQSGVASRSRREVLGKMLNPGTVSAVGALLLYLSGWQLPTVLLSPISSIGGMTTPLAMMIIGSSLANFPMGQLLRQKEMYIFSFLRLVCIPLTMLLLGRLLVRDPMLYGVMVLISAMPAGSIVSMYRLELGGNADFSTQATAFSTALCVVTIPLIAILM